MYSLNLLKYTLSGGFSHWWLLPLHFLLHSNYSKTPRGPVSCTPWTAAVTGGAIHNPPSPGQSEPPPPNWIWKEILLQPWLLVIFTCASGVFSLRKPKHVQKASLQLQNRKNLIHKEKAHCIHAPLGSKTPLRFFAQVPRVCFELVLLLKADKEVMQCNEAVLNYGWFNFQGTFGNIWSYLRLPNLEGRAPPWHHQ